jgi:GNAT superfamily N-acetyltransferase
MSINIVVRKPTAKEYNELRLSVQWPTYDENTVRCALQNTLYAVVAEDEPGLAIGMGRVLGDDAIYLHIQDVIVRPELQGKGIGKAIMNILMDYVHTRGSKNTNVGLMCSKGRESFYAGFGFIARPSEKFGAGMIRLLS